MLSLLIAIKVLISGLAVVAFSLIAECARPKRFAGLFAAAPSVALVSLAITAANKGANSTVPYARGMLIGSAGMFAYCLVSLFLIARLHALAGSIIAWIAWFVVAGALYLLVGR
jgi:uncharacterized membrane protein (GlpM family)